jgi:type II secretory pathway pseudopilin PulG
MKPARPKRHRSRGFALVASLALMILLTVVAVGLLSLSAISLRGASQAQAHAEAQANARLALMIAIGDLQKQLGPDQRISANGAILSETQVNHPHWTGVWNSWKAGASQEDSNPDPASAHPTIPDSRNLASGMNPTYTENRRDHFRSWLLSLDPGEATDVASARTLALSGSRMPAANATAVELVGDGSLGKSAKAADFVSARLLKVRSTATGGAVRGRYGWWIGDESQKARIMDDAYQAGSAMTLAEKISRHQAPGSTGTRRITGLANLSNDSQLAGLPSLATLDIVAGVTGRPSQNFHHVTPFSRQVLADVREGGLKRDLSTLLERTISNRSGQPHETEDEFMLYRFDTQGQERVPIQDLAAYYQLYNGYRNSRNQGVLYASAPSNLLNSGLQISSPDFHNPAKENTLDTYLREYTTLYRSPVPVKIQFLLGMTAAARTPSRDNPDTHSLQLGITPSVTFWNPTNLPLVMNFGDQMVAAQMFRLMNLPIRLTWEKNGGQYVSTTAADMNWATHGGFTGKANIFSVYFSGTRPIVFKPGEVRVFSLPYRAGNMAFSKTDDFAERHEMAQGWDAEAFLLMPQSDPSTPAAGDPNDKVARNVENKCLTFSAGDRIAVRIDNNNPSSRTEGNGAAMNFMIIQTSLQNHRTGEWSMRHYMFNSRVGSGTTTQAFNTSLMNKGFAAPGQTEIVTEPRSGAEIIAAAQAGSAATFLQFALMAGCEVSEATSGGAFAGRKFASRPFLHSTAIRSSFIDRDDYESFYNYGWNWWIEEVNSSLEATIQTNPQNPSQGYYGGGYTSGEGSSHVIQQEIPVVPPMSIASLSHAHLGGFTLANESIAPGSNSSERYNALVNAHSLETYQRTTASGHGGLFPNTVQAIGNSYAHPHIPADKAYTSWTRRYSMDQAEKKKTFADHSYLANKALWDEFFFSSITPQPSKVKVFGRSSDLNAKAVAKAFFFENTPLPNRRITPYLNHLDEPKLDGWFSRAQAFNDGLADLIATHLMVEGAFNVNSTSVEAWKVVLSSLKGKKIAYLDKDSALTGGIRLDEASTEGTPVGPTSLPNGKPFIGSSNDPSETPQWSSWRELSDTEIEELATAMVRQVKLRGPFLSLSEFVNRRLDSSNLQLSVKGALQAALDDVSVSINAGFRNPTREFSPAERTRVRPVFPEALDGPIAYGSAAYVDQADILRNFAAQLTPRGDTFVVRTYGDSLDAAGNVLARAWCEAVVQRVPEYFDSTDEAHLKQSALKSAANKTFGRKLRITGFRWLNSSEI